MSHPMANAPQGPKNTGSNPLKTGTGSPEDQRKPDPQEVVVPGVQGMSLGALAGVSTAPSTAHGMMIEPTDALKAEGITPQPGGLVPFIQLGHEGQLFKWEGILGDEEPSLKMAEEALRKHGFSCRRLGEGHIIEAFRPTFAEGHDEAEVASKGARDPELENLLSKWVEKRTASILYDAENETSYEEEISSLVGRLAEAEVMALPEGERVAYVAGYIAEMERIEAENDAD